MSGLFFDCHVALLDVSFFRKEFSDTLKEELKKLNVYVAGTFISVCGQYQSMLAEDKKKILQSNLSFINEALELKTVELSTFGDMSSGLNNDTWGILTLLDRLKGKFVFVTGNSMLIEKTILQRIHADIYDLNQEKMIRFEEFPEYERRIQFFEGRRWMLNKNASRILPDEKKVQVSEGSRLYLAGEAAITLGSEVRSGLESSIYKVSGTASLVAKVFKTGKFSGGKYLTLMRNQGIDRELETPWANFPKALLYFDSDCTIPAGFTEAYTICEGDLDSRSLYLGDLDALTYELDTKLSSTVNLCRHVVRQVGYLEQYGYLISDYNPGNFAFRKDGNMQMWDTDSFGYGRYFSGFCSGAKLLRDYDTSRKEEAMAFCTDALYQFVFSVCSLGDTAISDFSGQFKYDKVNYPARYRREFFPGNLWKLFEETFRLEREPSTELLLQELSLAEAELGQMPGNNRSYRNILDQIFEVKEESVKNSTKSRAAGNTASGATSASEPGSQISQMNQTNQMKQENADFRRLVIMVVAVLAVMLLLTVIF
ncbi:MAG: hypothetical protein Q4B15_06285, partial [Lachnospiraceae bacterium]|nr:hypothetical protein [Lachnospiraceae bacterium]